MIIHMKSPSTKAEEWLLIELQGEVISRHAESLAGKLVGELHFSSQGEPIFIIGHHVLFGRLLTMEKPFVVTKKQQMGDSVEHHVVAIIHRKLLFKTRPKATIVSVGKKQ
ncbi:Chromosome transmission fidelity protein 8 [Clonorchis sinensis]|uniref:Chromosome transmission fidelity protein 8 n=1 Tax=Clonorchis sinensis TaxID=79923 RepID=A0A8T1M821_CLOSI|nr:Chromosome transmission fidelity protein 8 [Clonorchis sinensis]